MSWAPEEHTRRSQCQAHDVRRWPQHRVLISVNWDELVRRAIIDVRHALVEVILPGHVESIMEPLRHVIARLSVLCLEHQVPGSAVVVILACTSPTCALDSVVPKLFSLAMDSANARLQCKAVQGVLQCLMEVVTCIRWQDITDGIPTKPQPQCMLLHACVLEDIHNAVPAIDFQKLRQQALHNTVPAILHRKAITIRGGSHYSGFSPSPGRSGPKALQRICMGWHYTPIRNVVGPLESPQHTIWHPLQVNPRTFQTSAGDHCT